MHGFLAAKGLELKCLGLYMDMDPVKQFNDLLNKFPNDQILQNTDQRICFLDGYVHNKSKIQNEFNTSWPDAFSTALSANATGCLQMLRGGFCGYLYDRVDEKVIVYTDQVSVKAVYYYIDGEKWIISNNFVWMLQVLKANGCSVDFNVTAAEYMLTYGYMLDDSTFVRQIHRVAPGCYVEMDHGKIKISRYYSLDNTEKKMTVNEAVERIDQAFRTAIEREFEKDREYGYQHLVDLSGGLDSRMVTWVAHEMGYTEQVNVAYSRSGYMDNIISEKIACYLKHEYIFKSLDDISWMYDIDELTDKNNGSALYCGITGGDRLLSRISAGNFGIEHTGLLGGSVVSTLYKDRKVNYQKPQAGYNRYSGLLSFALGETLEKSYSNQELFALNTRGFLGAQSSYMIRQHYFETAAPFADVDFLETILSIPFEYRVGYRIYLKWMHDKYPGTTEFGWEKWGGVKPKESCIWLRKFRTLQRLVLRTGYGMFGKENNDSMNPVDYWYSKDRRIQSYCNQYYVDNMRKVDIEETLRVNIDRMFYKGNFLEKAMALTVVAMWKKICEPDQE